MKAAPSVSALDAAKLAARKASALVAQDAPSVFALGQHLTILEKAANCWDRVSTEAYQTADEAEREPILGGTNQPEEDVLQGRIDAVRDLLETMPATSIQDAAVIVAAAITAASRLHGTGELPETANHAGFRIERMLLGVLPFIAEAAGLDMTEMDWAENDQLRLRRFGGVGVQS